MSAEGSAAACISFQSKRRRWEMAFLDGKHNLTVPSELQRSPPPPPPDCEQEAREILPVLVFKAATRKYLKPQAHLGGFAG